jgi:Protein of unknown function (DUF2950)
MRKAPGQRLSQSKEIAMMRGTKNAFENLRLPISIGGAVLAASALLAAGSVELCMAAPPTQTTFASPGEAGRALASAVQQHDEAAVREILGGGSALISSDDKGEDALDRERFAQKYQEMHRLVRDAGGITTLYIGAENWPFPVPLVSRNGKWRFESKVGSEEIRFRRIGENEVTAIGMCATRVTAEAHPGTGSEADRLVTTLLPQVKGATKPILFRGYYFRILSNSGGGFAAIAYPAIYRSSGVMTFIATQNGGVAEKDLGPNTANIAGAMTGYRADASWTAAE